MNVFVRGVMAGVTLQAVPVVAITLWLLGYRHPWRVAWDIGPGAWLPERAPKARRPEA